MKTSFDKKGQMIAKDLLPLTPAQEAIKAVLVKHYNLYAGNISRTAKATGLSRTNVLKLLHTYKLYDKYPHEPGPFRKEED